MTETTGQKYSVRLPVGDWTIIDGTLDNQVQTAVDGFTGDVAVRDDGWDTGAELPSPDVFSPEVRLGTSIRHAGWKQITGWHPEGRRAAPWPPAEEPATVTLTAVQWNLVVFALGEWAAVSERIDRAEAAARSRSIAAAVEQHLAGQGWSPEPAR